MYFTFVISYKEKYYVFGEDKVCILVYFNFVRLANSAVLDVVEFHTPPGGRIKKPSSQLTSC